MCIMGYPKYPGSTHRSVKESNHRATNSRGYPNLYRLLMVRSQGIEPGFAHRSVKESNHRPLLWIQLLTVEPLKGRQAYAQPRTLKSPRLKESNPAAIAHLHTTLNKSRDEKLIRAAVFPLSLYGLSLTGRITYQESNLYQ